MPTHLQISCNTGATLAAFYQRFGFKVMEDGVAMQIVNPGERY